MKNLTLIIIALVMVSCAPKESTDKTETSQNSTIDAKDVRKTLVEIKKVQAEEFTSYFEAKGSIESMRDVYISPELSGQIKTVNVDRGDRVKKGDLLIKLKTDITQNSIKEVQTSLELAEKIFEKQEQLWGKNIGSELQFLEAKNGKESLEARLATLESQLDLAFVRAPFDGIVEDIMIKTGELASPGMRMLRLVNLEKMRITAQVSESFLSKVLVGDEVELTFSSYPEMLLKERVHRLGTVIDPITRTFTVEVLVSNKDEMLKPNMLSTIKIQDYADSDALLVPSIILKQDFKGTFLFVAKKDGANMLARKVYVKTGKTVQDVTKVEKGLQADDQVIVKGFNLVSDGEPVSVMN